MNYEEKPFSANDMCKLCLKSSSEIGLKKRDISRLKSILPLEYYSQVFENAYLSVCVFCWRQINESLSFITMVKNANDFWLRNQDNQATHNLSIINLTKNKFILNIPENTIQEEQYDFFTVTNSKLLNFISFSKENIDIKSDLDDFTYSSDNEVSIDVKNDIVIDNNDISPNINNDSALTESIEIKYERAADIIQDSDVGKVKSCKETLMEILATKTIENKNPTTFFFTNKDDEIESNLLIKNNVIVGKEHNAKSTEDLKLIEARKIKLLKAKEFELEKEKAKDAEILKKLNIKEVVLNEEEQLIVIEDRKKAEKYLEAKFKCDLCGWFGITADARDKHMERHSELAGRYECNKCKCRFKTHTSLFSHIKLHKYSWVCLKCNFVLTRRHKCESHYTYCSGEEKPVKCHLCNKSVKNSYSLKRHIKHHVVRNKYKCDYCKKNFQSKPSIRYHITSVHKQVKPYQCNLCKKKLCSLPSLNAHMKTHETFVKDESAYCVECDKHFKHLEKHYKMKHKNVEKRFACDYCPNRFTYRYALQVHTNSIHLNNRTYCCQLCPKKYVSSGNLSEHMKRTHWKTERERRHVCNVCQKGFFIKNSLRQHMNTHTNLRPYKCETCSATFNFSAALYTHNKLKHKLNITK